MEKPDIDLKALSFGKIFQIDPLGTDPIQMQYGGDFLISSHYEEEYVLGFLANVHEQGTMTRFKGLAYLKIPWRYLECVGSVHWFKRGQEDEEKTESEEKITSS